MSDLPADDLGGFRRLPAQPAPPAAPAVDMGGFKRMSPPTSFAEHVWNSVKGLADTAGQMATAGPRFIQGAAEGVAGEGIPAGKASEFEGGAGRFAGRALGTGAKSVAESLWENLIKAPGKMLAGEMEPGPEAEAAARGIAMGMAGGPGWAPGKTLPGLAERPPRLTLGGSPPPAAGAAPAVGMRPSTVQPGSGPGTVMSGPQPLTPPITRPATVQPSAGPAQAVPAAPGSAMAAPPPAPVTPTPPTRPPPPVNPQADAATVSMYRQAVLPTRGQRSRNPQMDAYNRDVVTGVDEIIGNQANLQLTAPNGTPLPPGSTVPRSMKQFSEAIDQSEQTLFEQWNPMTQRAGDAGLRIDLNPVAAELRELAKQPKVALVNPQVVSQLERFATDYEAAGAVTPLEAQQIVTGINTRLKNFYAKGEAASGAPSEVLEPVARLLRKQLDEGIEGAIGPGWQELRNRYGALRSLDKDVTRAAERLANKPSSFLGKAGNFLASREFAHALITLNPAAMARAIGTKGAVELHKMMNDPNLMIERMFRQRINGPPRAANVAAPLTQGFAQPAMTYQLSRPGTQTEDRPVGKPITSMGGR